MLLDWFTVAAQIVNFLILVWLLRRFLYGRILHAIDERERKIAARLTEADDKNREAEQSIEQCRQRAAEIETSRGKMLEQAERDAAEVRKQMVEQARAEVGALEMRWREDWSKEQRTTLEQFRRRASAELLAAVRRAVADLASKPLEQSAVEALLQKLEAIDEESWRRLGSGELQICTSQPLPDDLRDEIRQALERRLGSPLALSFQQSVDRGWGIELRGGGYRIAWNSDAYLDGVEERLAAEFSGAPLAVEGD